MSGFDNEVLNCRNVDFREVKPVVGQMVADGQLLIGATVAPFIRAATLTAGTGISITNGAGSIIITNTGGGGGGGGTESLMGDSGSATQVGGVINVFGDTGITTTGAGDTLTISPANDLAALEALSGTGYVVRTGSETYTTRTFIAGTGISLSNADGVAAATTINASAAVPTTFTEDSGIATPSANNLNILGTSAQGISTSGSGATVTITAANATGVQKGVASFNTTNFTVSSGAVTSNALTVTAGTGLTTGGSVNLGGSVTLNLDVPVTVPHGGTGQTTLAANTVVYGNNAAAVGSTNAGTNGQLLIAATGAAPAFATVLGTNGITFVTGANALTISNTAIPNSALANSSISLNDGNNITITGSPVSLGGAATINVSGTTTNRVQIGNASGSLTSIGAGTNGQVLIGATGSAPAFGTLTSSNGSITFTPGASTLDLVANTTVGSVTTLTPDTGGAVSPSAGNINVLGQDFGSISVMDTHNTAAATLRVENRTWPTSLVVDPSTTVGARGTFSTIGAAITAATSGQDIFIRPGTYTENLTLKAGVNLTAFEGDDRNANVTIAGTCTMTTAGSVTISNIRLQTNGSFFLTVSGSAASVVNLDNCYLNMTDNTGISFTSSSSSAFIFINKCFGNIATTGITLFASTAAGDLDIHYCDIENTGNSTTASTIASGRSHFFYSRLTMPFTTSGTGSIAGRYTDFFTASQNATSLTIGGSGGSNTDCFYCRIASGTASAVSVSTEIHLIKCSVSSTNANALTGAGTIEYSPIDFDKSGVTMNVTTQTPYAIGPRILLSGGCQILSGAGSPNGSITAPQGSLWLRTNGTTTNNRMYVNTNGGTTWTAVTTVA